MAINVSQSFHRTSANPVDDTMTLTYAQMVAVNDNLMPAYYFTVCQNDGLIYLYDKSATPSATTGKFTKFEGGGGGESGDATLITATLLASGWSSNEQTVTATGIKATTNGVIGMLNTATTAQLEAARNAVLTVTAQAANSVTFTCENEPEIDIPVGILIGGGSGSEGSGLPDGGTTGQVLVKQSNADGDADWEDNTGGHTIINGAGTDMPERSGLQFIGATVTDNSASDKIVITMEVDKSSVAAEYNSANTYNRGDVVWHDGALYVCKTDSTTGTWDSSKFEAGSLNDIFQTKFCTPYMPEGTGLVVGKVDQVLVAIKRDMVVGNEITSANIQKIIDGTYGS